MDRGALWAIVHRVPKELGTAEGPNNRKHLQRASYAAFDSYNNPSKWTLLFHFLSEENKTWELR